MNMISASGLPTPKTVGVRERARCAHFVQPQTRSRTEASICALFDAVCCSRGPVGETPASSKEAATEYVDCKCASAFLDTRGARSLVSRILSSTAITSSRAGCIICSQSSEILHGAAISLWNERLQLGDWALINTGLQTGGLRRAMDRSRFNGLRCRLC